MTTQLAHPITDLTAALAEIDDRGYTVLPNVISPEQADEVRAAAEELMLAERLPQHIAAKTQRVGRIAVKNRIFQELLCNPTIIALWQLWMGDDMVCSTWSSNTTFAGYESLMWHADFPYWSMKTPWPAGNLAGQTIWMLDDFTVENGGTGVVPYSHTRLHGPEEQTSWREDAEILTGTRGSVAVLHGALWHTARSNQTQDSRTALLGMYTRSAMLTMEDMRGQLADIPNPSELLSQIMGANVYQPKDVVI